MCHDHGHGHGHGHGDHHDDHEDHNETHNHGTTVTTHHSHHHEVHCNHGDKHHHIVDVTVPLLKHSSEGEKKPKQQNINVQGAYLHVLGDSIQSIGAMIGGAITWYKPVEDCRSDMHPCIFSKDFLDNNPDVEEHFGGSDGEHSQRD